MNWNDTTRQWNEAEARERGVADQSFERDAVKWRRRKEAARERLTRSDYLDAVTDEAGVHRDPPQRSFLRGLTWRDVATVSGLIFALYMFATHVAGAAPWPVMP